MPVPYSLLLISANKPDIPEGICGSNHMIAWAIWSEFMKLSHVSLAYHNAYPMGDVTGWRSALAAQPRVDFTLMHVPLPGPIFDEMPTLKEKTKQQVIWISELPYPGMDHNFSFLPRPGFSEHTPLPAPRKLLNDSMVGVDKLLGSILLDHAILPNPNWAPFYAHWSSQLYDWLSPLKDSRVIGQLRRKDWESSDHVFPEWLKLVPQSSYTDYLHSTAPYENYVMTHPGTYEHSIIDMAARGIRVLVPKTHRSFADPTLVEALKLPTFTTREELLALLDKPLDESWRADLCTDIPKVAAQIDSHCQKVLNERHS